ncbi:glycoside hydrolase family 16 protein [Mollisia scopiformis]|uniref:Glycoside hydrolase family 16 protein n=1 Tax=Mollisia scopiformis TaxID=149040 RepID=A0A132BBX1_MOLSC|nr:glycoside hydrolase family 16 protein [Mollisia scopiformis]KUJ09920.1 glycoside hydrolase family 16 protein [Mollisia scopiformis]
MSVTNMLLFTIACLAVRSALAFCECGYATSISVNGTLTSYVFTDLIESDFVHIQDVASDTDWSRQNYSVTALAARGPYGMQFSLDNIVSNPLPNASTWSGPGTKGADPGVQLQVSGGVPKDGYIVGAQMNSNRQDLRYGTFRALMKLPSVNGTCSSFFWYFNNSQEIDMELLSSEFQPNPNNTYLINLVDQSLASVQRGYAIPGTEYMVADLPFDPADGYHEYRIDFIPGLIIYYADEQVIGTLNGSIPSMPGHMILTHWSNGDPTWSGGPPATEAVLAIAGVRAYFNSSDPERQAQATKRCTDPTASDSICYVPDYYPNNSLFTEYFSNEPNKTNNQTIYGKKSAADHNDTPPILQIVIFIVLTMILFAMIL